MLSSSSGFAIIVWLENCVNDDVTLMGACRFKDDSRCLDLERLWCRDLHDLAMLTVGEVSSVWAFFRAGLNELDGIGFSGSGGGGNELTTLIDESVSWFIEDIVEMDDKFIVES